MTNFKGTKGKWSVNIPKRTNGWVEVKYPDGDCIVRTRDYIKKEEDYGKKQLLKNTINHAKLIACAPEMLEMLETIFKDMQNETQLVHKWDIQKLIKKATDE